MGGISKNCVRQDVTRFERRYWQKDTILLYIEVDLIIEILTAL